MPRDQDRLGILILLVLAIAGLTIRAGLEPGPPGEVHLSIGSEGRPSRDSLESGSARLGRPLEPNERINVDSAPAAELARLPRIGPALAQRILSDRSARGGFGSLEGLGRVSGIGPATLDLLKGHVRFGPVSRPRSPMAQKKVNLNTATEAELVALPGLGPGKARAIVEDRNRQGPFRTLRDLLRVSGIGPKTLARLEALVVVP